MNFNYSSLSVAYVIIFTIVIVLLSTIYPAFAAVRTAVLWDFLFVPPLFTFRIEKPADWMLFCTLFVVALAMGHLAARLRETLVPPTG